MWRSEDDIEQACASGSIEESHHVDVKRELGPKAKGNIELAKDLAQFAIDGGYLVVGIDELGDGTFHPHPIDIASGIRERIDQVARSRCQPPLTVHVRAIPSRLDNTRGYVVVEVPQSPLAPHMVDGSYFGRSDSTRRTLTDTEVVGYHQARAARTGVADAELTAYMKDTPFKSRQIHAHAFGVAVPLTYVLAQGRTGRDDLRELCEAAVLKDIRTRLGHNLGAMPSDLTRATTFHERADGAAVVDYGLRDSRRPDMAGSLSAEENGSEVWVTETGIIRALMPRLSATHPEDESEWLIPGMAALFACQLVALAARWSEMNGYSGQWALGVAATGVKGLALALNSFERGPAFHQDEYRKLTETSTETATTRPRVPASALALRFAKATADTLAIRELSL